MALRKSISQDELREKQKQRGDDDNRHGSVYQPSRGGWFKPDPQNKR